ncbi:MAG: hypothetical protein AVDCRST_MAG02-1021 [uncultured Rubrobacteraceae bacterium]|uniref:Uncharacterized protein n=1 Tax=uncultured Rubrobacteraceae bacterium TaxID=349277 RepID=A0A6J4QRY4_9ACTN|nr:MAG: hypothetical protein AVDCRST_MAG02-1021 [uncultured Rubrobacteraceae bacterium]
MTEETRENVQAPRETGFREEARQLLSAAYRRQVEIWGKVTQMDLGVGADELGLDADRTAALGDFMEVAGWIEGDPYSANASRRITARGLAVLREN